MLAQKSEAFDPGERIGQSRLAALLPKPMVNLTPLHGVLAPNRRGRVLVTLSLFAGSEFPKTYQRRHH